MRQIYLFERLVKHSFKLQRFDFRIEHQKGSVNVVLYTISHYAEFLDIVDLSLLNIYLNSDTFKDDKYRSFTKNAYLRQSHLPGFKVVNSFLYKCTESGSISSEQKESCSKLWVPSALISLVIENCALPNKFLSWRHCLNTEAHSSYFQVAKIFQQVCDFVNQCGTCKATKPANTILRPPTGASFAYIRPFKKLDIDLLKHYPRTKNGKVGLIIVLDNLSKYPLL